MQTNLASFPHLLKKKCWGLSSYHGKITARASPPHSMCHSTAHPMRRGAVAHIQRQQRTYLDTCLLRPFLKSWPTCVLGLAHKFRLRKGGCEDKWIAGPGVWSCTCPRPSQTAFPSVSGWVIAWWKDKGIQYMCRICITHVRTYSPSWLLCSTNVSLQLWAPRNPCCEQQPDMILSMSGRRKTSWLAIEHKAAVPDS